MGIEETGCNYFGCEHAAIVPIYRLIYCCNSWFPQVSGWSAGMLDSLRSWLVSYYVLSINRTDWIKGPKAVVTELESLETYVKGSCQITLFTRTLHWWDEAGKKASLLWSYKYLTLESTELLFLRLPINLIHEAEMGQHGTVSAWFDVLITCFPQEKERCFWKRKEKIK